MTVAPTLAVTPKTAQTRLLARWELARRDPLMFLRWFATTNRATGRENVEAPFPWDRPHVRHLTQVWQANPLLAVKKCRQMMCTWWASAMALWDCLAHDGRLIMLQGKRLDDVVGDETTGDGLLGRAKYMLARIPAKRVLGIEAEVRTERVVFPRRGSTLWGIPQGGDIIRQRTASGIVSDECAFQPEFGDALTAAMPTIRGGGWFLAISTADMSDGGAFRAVVNDLDEESMG